MLLINLIFISPGGWIYVNASCMLVTLLTQVLGTRGAVTVAENDHKALRLIVAPIWNRRRTSMHALKQGVVSNGTWMRQALWRYPIL